MRLRSHYFNKIQAFKDFLEVYLGRSCADALTEESLFELFNRVDALYSDLEYIDIKTLLK